MFVYINNLDDHFIDWTLYCVFQHLDIAALLIKYNTSVNAVDRWGFTPLHEASQKGRTQLCALLVSWHSVLLWCSASSIIRCNESFRILSTANTTIHISEVGNIEHKITYWTKKSVVFHNILFFKFIHLQIQDTFFF